MGVFRHPYGFLESRCPLGGVLTLVDTFPNAAVGQLQRVRLDQNIKKWLTITDVNSTAQSDYGAYDETGYITKAGTSGTIANGTSAVGLEGFEIDVDKRFYFTAPQNGTNQLAYGTYDENGLASFSGYKNLSTQIADLGIDNTNGLWWGEAGSDMLYGSYDSNGVPSETGSVPFSGSRVSPFVVDSKRNKIFAIDLGTTNLYSADYDPTTGQPSSFSIVTSALIAAGDRTVTSTIDADKRLFFYLSVGGGGVVVYKYDETGTVFTHVTTLPVVAGVGSIDSNLSFLSLSDSSNLYIYKYC